MTTTDTIKRYMTVKETAEFFRLSKHTIYRMIKRGEIPYTDIGGTKRFDREKLENWAGSRTIEGKT